MKDDKRFYRKLKRELKREGNRHRRNAWKRQLRENPQEAPYAEYDFQHDSSRLYNGQDQDHTRRRWQAKDDSAEPGEGTEPLES